MYEDFYGFKEKPFSLIPDPEFLYPTRNHRMGITTLEYALLGQASITLISGEVGAGKTTLIQYLLRLAGDDVTTALITNTHTSLGGLLERILAAFRLEAGSARGVDLYRRFEQFLADEQLHGRRVLLIIDEAQNLEVEELEELRLISNVNTGKAPVFQIILSGQPEVLARIGRPELRQFAQRISVTYHLRQLTLGETRGYIRHRLRVAGGDPGLFDDAACAAVHICGSGVPRVVNSICDMALVYGFGEDQTQIGAETIINVAESLRLGGLRSSLRDNGKGDWRTSLAEEAMKRASELAPIDPEEEKREFDRMTRLTLHGSPESAGPRSDLPSGALNGAPAAQPIPPIYEDEDQDQDRDRNRDRDKPEKAAPPEQTPPAATRRISPMNTTLIALCVAALVAISLYLDTPKTQLNWPDLRALFSQNQNQNINHQTASPGPLNSAR